MSFATAPHEILLNIGMELDDASLARLIRTCRSHCYVLNRLLYKRASPQSRVLLHAARLGDLDFLRTLINDYGFSYLDDNSLSYMMLYNTVLYGNTEVAAFLLVSESAGKMLYNCPEAYRKPWGLIHAAARSGSVEMVKLLQDAGFDMVKLLDFYIPQHLTQSGWHDPLRLAIAREDVMARSPGFKGPKRDRKRCETLACYLVEHLGVSVERDDDGRSILELAIYPVLRTELARFLVQHGASAKRAWDNLKKRKASGKFYRKKMASARAFAKTLMREVGSIFITTLCSCSFSFHRVLGCLGKINVAQTNGLIKTGQKFFGYHPSEFMVPP